MTSKPQKSKVVEKPTAGEKKVNFTAEGRINDYEDTAREYLRARA